MSTEEELITLKVSPSDFLALTDRGHDCGCMQCLRLINNLRAQKYGNPQNSCFECNTAVSAEEAVYHETYRLCRICYNFWQQLEDRARATERGEKV